VSDIYQVDWTPIGDHGLEYRCTPRDGSLFMRVDIRRQIGARMIHMDHFYASIDRLPRRLFALCYRWDQCYREWMEAKDVS
jgi:hypothetical protein